MALCLNLLVTRQTEWHDYPSTALSQYIISTYGDMSLSQALDGIVSSQSLGHYLVNTYPLEAVESLGHAKSARKKAYRKLK